MIYLFFNLEMNSVMMPDQITFIDKPTSTFDTFKLLPTQKKTRMDLNINNKHQIIKKTEKKSTKQNLNDRYQKIRGWNFCVIKCLTTMPGLNIHNGSFQFESIKCVIRENPLIYIFTIYYWKKEVVFNLANLQIFPKCMKRIRRTGNHKDLIKFKQLGIYHGLLDT